MSTRCKACNSQLSHFDFYSNKSDTLPELEDLCSSCRGVAYNCEYLDTKTYAHEHLTESWEAINIYKE